MNKLIIDMHVDTLGWLRIGYDFFKDHDPKIILPWNHVDYGRLKQSGVTCLFLGLVSFPWTKKRSWRMIEAQIDCFEKLINSNPDCFIAAKTSSDVYTAFKDKKVAFFLGLEGVHCIGNDLKKIEWLASKGVKYITLAHFSKNCAATPCHGFKSNPNEGLTEFGINLIKKINDLKILIDLSHINKKGFMQAVTYTKYPPIVSHTGINEVYNHWRNIDDEQIKAISERGGVIGIMLTPKFLGKNSIEAVIEHINHLYKIGGNQCIAIGSDFDGLVRPIKDIKDITGLPKIINVLSSKGYTKNDIDLIMGGNVIRVLKTIDEVTI